MAMLLVDSVVFVEGIGHFKLGQSSSGPIGHSTVARQINFAVNAF